MTVTEESEGRLNAFAKEPKIEVIDQESSYSKGSWLVILGGFLLLISLIAFSFTIK
tara:strand:- start:609 stop:776 length:168 start_codon:yes stop_codon:yes gene_type:complete